MYPVDNYNDNDEIMQLKPNMLMFDVSLRFSVVFLSAAKSETIIGWPLYLRYTD